MILELTAFFRTELSDADGGEVRTSKAIFLNDDQIESIMAASEGIPELFDLTAGIQHLLLGREDDCISIPAGLAVQWSEWIHDNPALHRKLSFESLPLWMALNICCSKSRTLEMVQLHRREA